MKKTILTEIFYILTISLAIFSLMEVFWPRIVLGYVNLNWVLILWFLNAILVLLINNKKDKKYER